MDARNVPWITTEQMREVDRLMIERYGIELLQMMENAGRMLAELAVGRFFAHDPVGRHVLVLAGTGGNGGGALACARNLRNWGASVQVLLSRPRDSYAGTPARQLIPLETAAVDIRAAADMDDPDNPVAGQPLGRGPADADLIIDGVIGYSLSGAPRGGAARLLALTHSGAPVLSLDVPSGLDATTGHALGPAVRATATMTLALPKTGLTRDDGPALAGELYLADIGVPPELYGEIGVRLEANPFAAGRIIRIGGGVDSYQYNGGLP